MIKQFFTSDSFACFLEEVVYNHLQRQLQQRKARGPKEQGQEAGKNLTLKGLDNNFVQIDQYSSFQVGSVNSHYI